MKRKLLPFGLVLLVGVAQSGAMGVGSLQISGGATINYDEPFSGEHDTDEVVDATTVRLNFGNDFSNKRWSLRATEALTGSQDLRAGLDLTLGLSFKLDLFMFGKGHPEAVKYMVVQGMNLQDVEFNYTANTISLTLEPVAPAISASHTMEGYTGGFGIDFYYSGTAEDPAAMNYGPPIIVTDAFLDDVWAPMHPSSSALLGSAIRVDGVDDEPVNVRFLYGGRYLDRLGLEFFDVRGYVDGIESYPGFTFTGPATHGSSIDLGDPVEEFRLYSALNLNFSAVDIQAGVLPEPLRITGFSREGNGLRLNWNAMDGAIYSIETRDGVDGTPVISASGLTGPDHLVEAPAEAGEVRVYQVLKTGP